MVVDRGADWPAVVGARKIEGRARTLIEDAARIVQASIQGIAGGRGAKKLRKGS
jgi:hypothetical protein